MEKKLNRFRQFDPWTGEEKILKEFVFCGGTENGKVRLLPVDTEKVNIESGDNLVASYALTLIDDYGPSIMTLVE